jgi:hypothetical protein
MENLGATVGTSAVAVEGGIGVEGGTGVKEGAREGEGEVRVFINCLPIGLQAARRAANVGIPNFIKSLRERWEKSSRGLGLSVIGCDEQVNQNLKITLSFTCERKRK